MAMLSDPYQIIHQESFISPSQEELLANLPGWEDQNPNHGVAFDFTPSQAMAHPPAPTKSPSSASASSTDSDSDSGEDLSALLPAQQPAIWLSPADSTDQDRDGTDADEDSFKNAFESDRDQSPPHAAVGDEVLFVDMSVQPFTQPLPGSDTLFTDTELQSWGEEQVGVSELQGISEQTDILLGSFGKGDGANVWELRGSEEHPGVFPQSCIIVEGVDQQKSKGLVGAGDWDRHKGKGLLAAGDLDQEKDEGLVSTGDLEQRKGKVLVNTQELDQQRCKHIVGRGDLDQLKGEGLVVEHLDQQKGKGFDAGLTYDNLGAGTVENACLGKPVCENSLQNIPTEGKGGESGFRVGGEKKKGNDEQRLMLARVISSPHKATPMELLAAIEELQDEDDESQEAHEARLFSVSSQMPLIPPALLPSFVKYTFPETSVGSPHKVTTKDRLLAAEQLQEENGPSQKEVKATLFSDSSKTQNPPAVLLSPTRTSKSQEADVCSPLSTQKSLQISANKSALGEIGGIDNPMTLNLEKPSENLVQKESEPKGQIADDGVRCTRGHPSDVDSPTSSKGSEREVGGHTIAQNKRSAGTLGVEGSTKFAKKKVSETTRVERLCLFPKTVMDVVRLGSKSEEEGDDDDEYGFLKLFLDAGLSLPLQLH